MNYQYFGLFLNEHNRNELMKIIFANPIIANPSKRKYFISRPLYSAPQKSKRQRDI